MLYYSLENGVINEEIINLLREYIKDHYSPLVLIVRGINGIANASSCTKTLTKGIEKQSSFRGLSDKAAEYIKKNKTKTDFAHILDKKREEKGLTPAALYKRANVDRRQYSRFMGPEGRHPSMNTAISFGLALRLNRQELDEFLQTAGYSLSDSSSRDVCIMFCLENSIYNIDDVNALLFAIGIEPLSKE